MPKSQVLKTAFEEFDALINSSRHNLGEHQEKVRKGPYRNRNSCSCQQNRGNTIISQEMNKLLFGDEEGRSED